MIVANFVIEMLGGLSSIGGGLRNVLPNMGQKSKPQIRCKPSFDLGQSSGRLPQPLGILVILG